MMTTKLTRLLLAQLVNNATSEYKQSRLAIDLNSPDRRPT